MALDLYWATLLLLLPLVILFTGRSLLLRSLRLLRSFRLRRQKHAFRPLVSHGSTVIDVDTDEEASGKEHAAPDMPSPTSYFRRIFLEVYLLVMGSEWLQVPYTYALLRDEKRLPEHTVAAMYVTAYVAAAVFAPVAGFLADRYGRKKACLAFCALHSASSLTVLSNNVRFLFAGRALAGLAMALLVFESWMVTEWYARGFGRAARHHQRRTGTGKAGSGMSLSGMFGTMTLSNCTAAILGGVVGGQLALGSRMNPFIAGVALDVAAAVMILIRWNENYGTPWSTKEHDAAASKCSSRGLKGMSYMRVWALSFVSCCFEGTNFLVLFFWPGIIRDAHAQGRVVHPPQQPGLDATAAVDARPHQRRNFPAPASSVDDGVPYGVVFASFMAAMILGALLFNTLVQNGDGLEPAWSGSSEGKVTNTSSASSPQDRMEETSLQDQPHESLSRLTTAISRARSVLTRPHVLLGCAILGAASLLLLIALLVSPATMTSAQTPAKATEPAILVAFLLFEVCNGVYVPSVAYQRGIVVDESSRAGLYGLMKLPLFIFVIVALCTTVEDQYHRRDVFIGCAVTLSLAAVACFLGLGDRRDGEVWQALPSADPEGEETEVE